MDQQPPGESMASRRGAPVREARSRWRYGSDRILARLFTIQRSTVMGAARTAGQVQKLGSASTLNRLLDCNSSRKA